MAQFHFVEDYVRRVRTLMAQHPLDDAMSLAVGGDYELVGRIEADLLQHLGLQGGMTILDFGCGSGRLAHVLGTRLKLRYAGLDVVQELLDYAKSKSPPNYAFKLHRELNLPILSSSCDFVVAFSVFTHLLHAESFIYLEEMRRVAKPGGKIVFSFLEFADAGHWEVFARTVAAQRKSKAPHLNTFIERSALQVWADKLNLRLEQVIPGNNAPWGEGALGQATAVLSRLD